MGWACLLVRLVHCAFGSPGGSLVALYQLDLCPVNLFGAVYFFVESGGQKTHYQLNTRVSRWPNQPSRQLKQSGTSIPSCGANGWQRIFRIGE